MLINLLKRQRDVPESFSLDNEVLTKQTACQLGESRFISSALI